MYLNYSVFQYLNNFLNSQKIDGFFIITRKYPTICLMFLKNLHTGNGTNIFSGWYIDSGFNNVSDSGAERIWRHGRVQFGWQQYI